MSSNNFTYDPDKLRVFFNNLFEKLYTGETDISKRFGDQLEALTETGVWTGPAAKKNFDQFKETDQTIKHWFNETLFSSLKESIAKVNQTMRSFETGN